MASRPPSDLSQFLSRFVVESPKYSSSGGSGLDLLHAPTIVRSTAPPSTGVATTTEGRRAARAADLLSRELQQRDRDNAAAGIAVSKEVLQRRRSSVGEVPVGGPQLLLDDGHLVLQRPLPPSSSKPAAAVPGGRAASTKTVPTSRPKHPASAGVVRRIGTIAAAPPSNPVVAGPLGVPTPPTVVIPDGLKIRWGPHLLHVIVPTLCAAVSGFCLLRAWQRG